MIAGKCRGLTGFWCTDGYAVCGYAEAAATIKDIVVSVDDVGVSKTPGLRVNAPPSARSRPIRIGCSGGLGTGFVPCGISRIIYRLFHDPGQLDFDKMHAVRDPRSFSAEKP